MSWSIGLSRAVRVVDDVLRKVALALCDLVFVDRNTLVGISGESHLEGADAVEGVAVLIASAADSWTVAKVNDPRENTIQTIAGTHIEALGVPRRHRPHVHTGEAVGLLLLDQTVGVHIHQAGHPLQRMPVLVCDDPDHPHLPEVFDTRGHERTSVPGNQFVPDAVERIRHLVGFRPAQNWTTGIGGVVGDEFVDRFKVSR